jgi:hypothetical protein
VSRYKTAPLPLLKPHQNILIKTSLGVLSHCAFAKFSASVVVIHDRRRVAKPRYADGSDYVKWLVIMTGDAKQNADTPSYHKAREVIILSAASKSLRRGWRVQNGTTNEEIPLVSDGRSLQTISSAIRYGRQMLERIRC